jgi:chromosome segregation ATPase
MAALDLDQATDKFIPRAGDSTTRGFTLARQPTSGDADAALGLVSEAAAAIRELEKQSAEAVARAFNVANAVKEELERAETRADRAEATLRLAEAEVEEFISAIAQSRRDVEMLQSQLAAREAELAASEQRANGAERRADDAEAAIQKIVDAIRSQLPVKPGGAPARRAAANT